MMHLKREEGAAAVEFALVLLPLLILLFGIIEFGMILYFQGVVSSASREGARYGITVSRPDEGKIREKIDTYYAPMLPGPYTIDLAHGDTNPGEPLTVTVTYDYTYIVIANLIPGLATDGKRTLTGKTTMYYE